MKSFKIIETVIHDNQIPDHNGECSLTSISVGISIKVDDTEYHLDFQVPDFGTHLESYCGNPDHIKLAHMLYDCDEDIGDFCNAVYEMVQPDQLRNEYIDATYNLSKKNSEVCGEKI